MQNCVVVFMKDGDPFDKPVASFFRKDRGSSVYLLKQIIAACKDAACDSVEEYAKEVIGKLDAQEEALRFEPHDAGFDFDCDFGYCIYPNHIEAYDMRVTFQSLGKTTLYR